MNERPELTAHTDAKAFREYYYLKQELVSFCWENGLPASGSKGELTERIAVFLETGRVQKAAPARKTAPAPDVITESTLIEENITCSEKHRAFFKERIGKSFSFNVQFQKWLKGNAGRTYAEAIDAYHQIMQQKKSGRTVIDRQFEYNTYIRDFFADNKGRSLEDAIKCWKYKKALAGHDRYERSDLKALEE